MGTSRLNNKIVMIKELEKPDNPSLIIKRIKTNDMSAFWDWLDCRKEKFYKIGWSYLYNQHDIEDVFQVTIINVCQNIGQLREIKYFETWVTSIFINECKAIYRKKQKETPIDYIEEPQSNNNSDQFIDLRNKLNALDDFHREVIILKYIAGYSQEEISNMLSMPLGTVKSRIYRGLALLRNQMD